MIGLLLVALLAFTNAKRCNLPGMDMWEIQIKCDGGSVVHNSDFGVILECPNGIAANSVGIEIKFLDLYSGSRNAAGHAALDYITLPAGGASAELTAIPYVSVSGSNADDSARLEARLESWFGKKVARVLAVDPQGMKEDYKDPTDEGEVIVNVDLLRDFGESEGNPNKAQVKFAGVDAELTLTDTMWTTDDFHMTLTLGNLGAKDSVGKHSVTLTKQGGGTNGVVPLTGSVLCALYQEYVPTPAPPATPPPSPVADTPPPTPVPIGTACADIYQCQLCFMGPNCQWCQADSGVINAGTCTASGVTCEAPNSILVGNSGTCPTRPPTPMPINMNMGCTKGDPCAPVDERKKCPEGQFVEVKIDECDCKVATCVIQVSVSASVVQFTIACVVLLVAAMLW